MDYTIYAHSIPIVILNPNILPIRILPEALGYGGHWACWAL